MSKVINTVTTRLLIAPLLAFCAMVFSPSLFAAQEPQAMVEQVTKELLDAAKVTGNAPDQQDAFYEKVGSLLDEVVDFRYIARAVMGKEAFSKATPAQRSAFTDAFKSGLVKSYAKGIAGYVNSDIKVVGATVSPKDATRAVVRQEVSYEGNVHQLSYSLRQQGDNWKLINVILNGVNLGQSFSSQFSAAMRKEGGDLDKVIAGWLAEV
jgi:phospholipid transport system substrate-binding protein